MNCFLSERSCKCIALADIFQEKLIVNRILQLGTDHYFFDVERRVRKFSHGNIFFFAAPAAKNWFCVSFFLQILFLYLHTIYFSVYSLCKQFISKFFPPPPPPRQKHNGQSLSFLINKRLLKLEKIVNIITIIIIFVIIIVLAYYKNQIKKTCWQRQHEENQRYI